MQTGTIHDKVIFLLHCLDRYEPLVVLGWAMSPEHSRGCAGSIRSDVCHPNKITGRKGAGLLMGCRIVDDVQKRKGNASTMLSALQVAPLEYGTEEIRTYAGQSIGSAPQP
jgi:hypothetical protein